MSSSPLSIQRDNMMKTYPDHTWREQERVADERNAREVGQLMLWAMAERVPVTVHNTLDRYDIAYPIIEAVVYVPNRHTPSVRLRDGKASDCHVTVSARKAVPLLDPPEPLPDIRPLVELSDQRKKELFDAMRSGCTVKYGRTEYRRIRAILFRVDPESGRIVVTVELVRVKDCGICELPQLPVKPTGHTLNRGR